MLFSEAGFHLISCWVYLIIVQNAMVRLVTVWGWVCAWVGFRDKKKSPWKSRTIAVEVSLGWRWRMPPTWHLSRGYSAAHVCSYLHSMFFQEKTFSMSQTTGCEGCLVCYFSGLRKAQILIILLAFLLSEVKMTQRTEDSWSESLLFLPGS